MLKIKSETDISDPTTLEAAKNLGRLCRQIGYAIGAVYQDNGTGAYPTYLKSWISNYISQLSVSEYRSGYPNAREEIGNGLIMMNAEDIYSGVSHAFIIDGYNHTYTEYEEQTREVGSTIWKSTGVTGSYTQYTHHVNWGWRGKADGYFAINNLSPAYYTDNKEYISHSYRTNPGYYIITK